MSNSLKEQS